MPRGIGVLTIHTGTTFTYDVAWKHVHSTRCIGSKGGGKEVHPRSPSHRYLAYDPLSIFLCRYLNDLVRVVEYTCMQACASAWAAQSLGAKRKSDMQRDKVWEAIKTVWRIRAVLQHPKREVHGEKETALG